MTDNLPRDHRDVPEDHIVGQDSRGNDLTYLTLAERLMQVEAHRIQQSITDDNDWTHLAYMLEGGFRGYHKMSSGELWSEWTDVQEHWFSLYDGKELPWEVYHSDPMRARQETA